MIPFIPSENLHTSSELPVGPGDRKHRGQPPSGATFHQGGGGDCGGGAVPPGFRGGDRAPPRKYPMDPKLGPPGPTTETFQRQYGRAPHQMHRDHRMPLDSRDHRMPPDSRDHRMPPDSRDHRMPPDSQHAVQQRRNPPPDSRGEEAIGLGPVTSAHLPPSDGRGHRGGEIDPSGGVVVGAQAHGGRDGQRFVGYPHVQPPPHPHYPSRQNYPGPGHPPFAPPPQVHAPGYDRGPDRGSDRGSERGPDRGPERGPDRGYAPWGNYPPQRGFRGPPPADHEHYPPPHPEAKHARMRPVTEIKTEAVPHPERTIKPILAGPLISVPLPPVVSKPDYVQSVPRPQATIPLKGNQEIPKPKEAVKPYSARDRVRVEFDPQVDPMKQDFQFYVMDNLEPARESTKRQILKSHPEAEKPKGEIDTHLMMTILNARLINMWERETPDCRAVYLKKEEGDRRRFMNDDEIASRHCATLTSRSRSPKNISSSASFGLSGSANTEIKSEPEDQRGSTLSDPNTASMYAKNELNIELETKREDTNNTVERNSGNGEILAMQPHVEDDMVNMSDNGRADARANSKRPPDGDVLDQRTDSSDNPSKRWRMESV